MALTCLEDRFEMMNPVITKFMELESKLFYSLAKVCKNLDGVTEKFKRVQAKVITLTNTYILYFIIYNPTIPNFR